MIDLEDELAEEYLAEAQERLMAAEADLMAIEREGVEIDRQRFHRVFRALHWIQGGAGFFDLITIRDLARQAEEALTLLRSGKAILTPDRVRVLLDATGRLDELLKKPATSNQAGIAELTAALAGLPLDRSAQTSPVPATHAHTAGAPLRVLLVEDDFTSRLVLQTFLSRYGECHVAVNGREAIDAFSSALERGQSYDLICMDVMMPEVDGGEAVRRIRALEEELGILSTYGAKIIMTTAVDNVKEVSRCFMELCDAYLVKPIDLNALLNHLKSYHLVR